MKVILTQDVPDVGRAGTVLNVAPGYARNYLYPRGLAVEATESNLRQLSLKRKRAEDLAAIERSEAAELAERLSGVELHFTLKAGELGQLYGSVAAPDIAAALLEKGYEIDRRKILLKEHIKRTGGHSVDVRLLGEISARIRVIVEAEQAEEDKGKAEPAAEDEAPAEQAQETSAETPAEATTETS